MSHAVATFWRSLPRGSITIFLQLVVLFGTQFIASKRKRKNLAKIWQMKAEDLKKYVLRFNCEVILIPDLQDEVVYVAFLNGFLLGWFKFSLAESKVTTLADALRRNQDFIQETEICARDEFIHQESWKRLGKDKDAQPDKRPKRNKARDEHFHTSPRNFLMEIKASLCCSDQSLSKFRLTLETRIGMANIIRTLDIQL